MRRIALALSISISQLTFGQASIYTTPWVFNPAKDPGFKTAQYESWTYQRTKNGAIQRLPFRMLKPLSYSKLNKPYPLVIMLHGHGERGTDNNFQLKWGGKAHQDAVNANIFKGFVVFPQEPFGSWTNASSYSVSQPTTALSQVFDLVDSLLIKYNIDPDRVYIHGLSSGGTGTWAALYHRPDLFAAALPMSAPGDLSQVSKIAVTPIWLFQGSVDGNPVPSISQNMMNALRAEGAINTALTRYTEYAGVGHGVWNLAYAEPDFFSYMLAQNKKNIMVLGTNPLPFFGGSVSLGIASNMGAYQWYKDGVMIPSATSYRLNGVKATGSYTVKFKRKASSLTWETSYPVLIKRKYIITYPLREQLEEEEGALSMYPNPTQGQTVLTLPYQIQTGTILTVMNTSGAVVYTKDIVDSETAIDLSGLDKGLYIANISDGTRKENVKLIIE